MSFSVVEILAAGAIGAVSVGTARAGLLALKKVRGRDVDPVVVRGVMIGAIGAGLVISLCCGTNGMKW